MGDKGAETKMKKIIMIMMFVLMLGFVSGLSYPYDSDQFGNVNWGGFSNSLLGVGSDNRTYCQPFVAQETGTITQVGSYGSVSIGVVEYCLSDTLTHPVQDVCTGNYGTGTVWFPRRINTSLPVVKDNTYWMCYGQYSTGGASTNGIVFATFNTGLYPDSLGVTTPYGLTQPDTNTSNYLAEMDKMTDGVWDGWSTTTKIFRDFVHCYSTGCYVLSPAGLVGYTFNNPASNGLVGQSFRYDFATSNIEDVTFRLTWGYGTAGTEQWRVELHGFDSVTNLTTTSLYNSSNLAYSLINTTASFTEVTHVINDTIFLINGNDYLIGVRCVVGCTVGASDRIHLAKTEYYNGETESWQKVYGAFYNDDFTYKLRPDADAWFRTTMGDEIWSETTNITCAGTICTEWDSPYFLKENFDGYINMCGWSTYENVCFGGQFVREQSDSQYTFSKNTDLVNYQDSRYVTVSFDLKPDDISVSGSFSVSIYDSEGQRFIQFLAGDSGELYNYDNGDNTLVYSNASTSTLKNVNLHIDLVDDDYDLWYDGVLVASGLGYTNSFYNIDDINSVQLTTYNAGMTLDNFYVYSTDQNNQITIPDIDVTPTADETVSWCGLFKKVDTYCNVDSDCETDSCMPSGKCNRFDMTYCDDNGHTRTNYCMVAGMTSCVLESSSDLILDNFLLFLVLLVMLVMVAYVVYTFKK